MHYSFNLATPTRRACGIHPYADPVMGMGDFIVVQGAMRRKEVGMVVVYVVVALVGLIFGLMTMMTVGAKKK